ncbi:MAG: hypothetical protein JEZ02_05690 [Desulfatibacillum sp.]|nr:hypothetical protein [Desulfatibacillum sp.]
MKNASFEPMTTILPARGFASGFGMLFRASTLIFFAIFWLVASGAPCYGGQDSVQAPPGKSSPADSIPQWSWDWVDDLREGTSNLIPVPVTLNPQSSFRSSDSARSTYRLTKEGLEGKGPRSLFSVLDDGEALLDLLDRTGHESGSGFEGMLSDTLNTSFLSMGSRLEFHVSKRFLPYLGGGIIYGGRDSSSSPLENIPKATGYELGVGFTFSDAPVRFGVDLLYRGMDLDQEDRGMAMRKDEFCPNSFDKDGYSMSAGFTFHF